MRSAFRRPIGQASQGPTQGMKAAFQRALAADLTTTSTSYVDVPGMSIDVDVLAGDVLLIYVNASLFNTGGITQLQLVVDGVAVAAAGQSLNQSGTIAIAYRVTGLAAGTRTCKLQWKVTAGTGTCTAATDANHHMRMLIQQQTA